MAFDFFDASLVVMVPGTQVPAAPPEHGMLLIDRPGGADVLQHAEDDAWSFGDLDEKETEAGTDGKTADVLLSADVAPEENVEKEIVVTGKRLPRDSGDGIVWLNLIMTDFGQSDLGLPDMVERDLWSAEMILQSDANSIDIIVDVDRP